ncbi:MAG: 23S rRNA (guanosine(2251)-2'-O)-methyltransferase RlmB [Acidobacteria bacterium]|nr:MAG: 23S rRNA (guanosine(2251)-2'-O)-methyltransferase RlmB [Acidobacteriota bacterium]REK02202.1 MAG: 23S rRNA (guanosine(2251)-2'-O)-methyltransferase RlmB [Acidobacteriota bacterium]REK13995.1 MAG: 23S rRNA (guanosine(2251)-2'-O)-methyltransferase RlmB [Acidobacteriota bacterium]REK41990.1 MAG: 23S rRNA (guanosine(2251)-2'-O)-methyltransferase RlmB [Acidobacteriota bacterium]
MKPNRKVEGSSRDDASILFGIMPVLEALRSGSRPIERILLADGKQHKRIREIIELAKQNRVPIRKVERNVLEKEVGRQANHQGVIAIGSAAGYANADDIIEDLAKKNESLCLILDGVEDPHNLGAIIRSAECAGVDAVFIPERRSAGLNETVSKTSAGAADLVNIARVTNINRLIEDLKQAGFWIAGASGASERAYSDQDWSGKWALVLGSEGTGIHRLTSEKCDVLVRIPLYGRIESLNVSVAAGVLLFEAQRQRYRAKISNHQE